MNIVLTGPMGSGKSAVGKVVAEKMKLVFMDIDEEMEKRSGITIREIFEASSEDHFRNLEEEIVRQIANLEDHVIATGGGAVLRPVNMRRLRKKGLVINLRASIDSLLERIGMNNDRPLLNAGQSPKASLEKILEERSDLYQNADHFIDTDGKTIEDIANEIINLAKLPRIRICACIAGNNTLANITKAQSIGASMVELRLDLMEEPDISGLIAECALPVIATDRGVDKSNLKKAIEAGCDIVDIEIEFPEKEELMALARHKRCRIILSHHDHEGTPEVFDQDFEGADIIKMATTLRSREDGKKLLSFLLEKTEKEKIVIGMGQLGQYTRVAFPMLGSFLTYASFEDEVAPGQMNIHIMNRLYQEMGLKGRSQEVGS